MNSGNLKRNIFTTVIGIFLMSGAYAQSFYTCNFNSGTAGWTTGYSNITCQSNTTIGSCSWNLASQCGGTPITFSSTAYGTANDGYNGPENSWIRSPYITVTTPSIRVDFDSWTANESGFPCYYDAEYIEISQDSGVTWTPIHAYVNNLHDRYNDRAWRHITLFATVTPNTSILLRFRLDTGDDYSTLASRGWYIDNVEVKPGVEFQFTKNNTTCEGSSNGSITFSSITGGTYPFMYSINGGSTFQTSNLFSNLPAGNYTLIVRDGANRLSSPMYTTISPSVVIQAQLVATASRFCAGSQTTLQAASNNGYSYVWKRNNTIIGTTTTPDHITSTPGTYAVRIDYNGCSKESAPVTLVEMAKPAYTASSAATCPGMSQGSITFQAPSAGTAPFRYSIDNGSNYSSLVSFNNLAAATYTTRVADSNNCVSNPVNITVSQVTDTRAPVLQTQTVTLTLDPTGTATLDPAQLDAGSTDDCAIVGRSVSPSTFNTAHVGTQLVLFRAWDASGNFSDAYISITINASTPNPVAIAKNINLYLGADGTATLTGAQVDDGSQYYTSLSVSKSQFTCNDIGPQTVQLTAHGTFNRIATAVCTVTILDQLAPVIRADSSITLVLSNGVATLTAAQVNNNSTDNCGIDSIWISQTYFDENTLGIIPVTFRVTDIHGNYSEATIDVTVEAPDPVIITKLNPSVELDEMGSTTISAATVDSASREYKSLSLSTTSFNCGNVGFNQLTVTAHGYGGKSATSTCYIQVKDTNRPKVRTRNRVVTLVNGVATITPNQIDSGSWHACGIAALNLSRNTFNANDVGTQMVVLTAVDVYGKSSSAPATVTVLSEVNTTCEINLVRGSGPDTKAPTSTIYLGYGPQSVTLQGSVTTGVAPYTYSWSGSSELSNTTGWSTVFTPTAAGQYTITCTANSMISGSGSASVTICVIDARDGIQQQTNKVILCHNNTTISVDTHAVSALLNALPETRLGACNTACVNLNKFETKAPQVTQSVTTRFQVYPNPSNTSRVLTFRYDSEDLTPYTLRIYDLKGALLYELTNQLPQNNIVWEEHLETGVYLAVVTQNGKTQTARIVKTQ